MSSEYTAADVAKHNKVGDYWVIYNGEVYDVSRFVDEHPGGEEVIADVAGTDATEAFDDIGHSEEAHEIMVPLKIGTLKGGTVKQIKTAQSNTNESDEGSSLGTTIGLLLVIIAIVVYYGKQNGLF
ncbi:cytochrome b5 [Diutina catenulata]